MAARPKLPEVRPFPARVYLALKTHAGRLTDLVGGVEAAGLVSRGSAGTFSQYRMPRYAAQMPIDVVADLEQAVGEPIVTRELAALSGYLLIPAPQGRPADITMTHLARMAKEQGEALSALLKAHAVGDRITAAEIRRDRLIEETDDAIQIYAEIREALIARLERGDNTEGGEQ